MFRMGCDWIFKITGGAEEIAGCTGLVGVDGPAGGGGTLDWESVLLRSQNRNEQSPKIEMISSAAGCTWPKNAP